MNSHPIHPRLRAVSGFAPGAGSGQPPPQTLVDKVIDTVMAEAARGAILPGDRIVEADIAQRLGISRVPVREALRLLESQSVVTSEPYKGIRLRPVTAARVDDLIEARVALETSAACRALAAGRNARPDLVLLQAAVGDMSLMAERNDSYGLARADTAFHRALCQLGGNSVVSDLWETLARQMTVIFGLSTFGKSMAKIVDEHRLLVRVFRAGDAGAMARAIDDHINVQTHAIDFEAIIAERRRERGAAAGASGAAKRNSA